MTDRIRTLVLYSNGAGWRSVLADTVIRGLCGIEADESALPAPLGRTRLAGKLLGRRYEALSYVNDWLEAFCRADELQVDTCNINNFVEYSRRREAIERYPLVVILHSAAGDSVSLLQKTAGWFQRRQGKLVVFVGNEYDLMEQKFRFLRAVGADYVCSQLPIETSRWLYAECGSTEVIAMPHALNPRAYRPNFTRRRTIDVGFRGDAFGLFLGDTERTDVINAFRERGQALGLNCDINFARLHRRQWASFLQSCKTVVGAESGTYYMDRQGLILARAKAYLAKHPQASMQEMRERFFEGDIPPHRSGKCVSSRHFEAIGAGACQVLLEGDFNGILRAGEHYIAVKKDHSNFEEAAWQLKDDTHRQAIADRAYQHVINNHTYPHRIKSLIRQVIK